MSELSMNDPQAKVSVKRRLASGLTAVSTHLHSQSYASPDEATAALTASAEVMTPAFGLQNNSAASTDKLGSAAKNQLTTQSSADGMNLLMSVGQVKRKKKRPGRLA